MKAIYGALAALSLVVMSNSAVAIDVQLDRAATQYEGVAEHFHETVHHEAPASHLDEDAHELAEAAHHFHEEVHHGHGQRFLQNVWSSVRSLYNHTSHTYWQGWWRWTSHIREDWRLVSRAHRNVEHELYWGGHHHWHHPHH